MSDVNRLILSGRIGTDIELKKTNNGTSVVNFSIGVNYYAKDTGNKTMWMPVTAWRQNAEYLQKYAKKGNIIMVDGRIDINQYTDAGGTKHTFTNMIAESFRLIGGNNSEQSAAPTNTFESLPDLGNLEGGIEISPEDVPF